MSQRNYKETLNELQERYRSLFQRRREMKSELYNLAKSIEGLAALCGEEPNIPKLTDTDATEVAGLLAESWLKHMPFADAVRTALRIVAPIAFTTSEIRGFLSRAGYPIDLKTDPMVSLNVALKRLHDSEEVEVVDKEGRKAYRWAYKYEMAPLPDEKPRIDWEAFLRTANQFGYAIAELDPYAADRQFMGEENLTSAEEREIDLYLRNKHATVPLTLDQLYKTFCMSHEVKSPRKTREFMESFLNGRASPYRRVPTKDKQTAYIQKRG